MSVIKDKITSSKGLFIEYVIILILSIMAMLGVHQGIVKPMNKKTAIGLSNDVGDTVVGEITDSYTVSQTFKITNNYFKGISIEFATYARMNTGELDINLVDTTDESIIQNWKVDVNTLSDNVFYDLVVGNNHKFDKSRIYRIDIHSQGCESGDAVTIWTSENDSYNQGQCMVNNVPQNGDLSFKLLYQSKNFFEHFYRFICIMILLFFVAFAVFQLKGSDLKKQFVVYMFVWGIIYMFILPPYSAPDEIVHYNSAYHLTNCIMGQTAADKNLVNGRVGDLNSKLYDIRPNLTTYKNLYDNMFKKCEDDTLEAVIADKVEDMVPTEYFPQTIGMLIGRLLNLNFTSVFMLGRLFNLICYIFLMYFAIKIIPFGKNILLICSFLPMLLELISSLSYDTIIIALSILFTAIMMDFIYAKENITYKDFIAPTIIIFLLAPLKIVYMPLAFLCLLVPKSKFKDKKTKWIFCFIIMLSAVASTIIFNLGDIAQAIHPPKTLRYADVKGYSIKYLILHPVETIYIYCSTVWNKLDFYITTMIGAKLAWLEIDIPSSILIGFSTIVLLSGIKTEDDNNHIQGKEKIFYGVVLLIISALILLSMLSRWTPFGSHTIEGVQGRYFLPILPLLLLILRNKLITIKKDITPHLVLVAVMLNIVTIFKVLQVIAFR